MFLLVCFFVPLAVFAQDASSGPIPLSVRQPARDETPRYPRDVIIGDIGRGTAPQAAYISAREFLNAIIRGSRTAQVLSGVDTALLGNVFEEVESIRGERYHIGGGRIEVDGSASFLVRFLGREYSIVGELYLVQHESEEGPGPWRIDDFLLEESQDLNELHEPFRHNFPPYDRLY